MPKEPRTNEGHDGDFKNFHRDRDSAFAETVRQIASQEGKQDEGQGEKHADVFSDFMFFRQRHVQSQEHEDDEFLEEVVAERTLELCDKERPKAAPGIWV